MNTILRQTVGSCHVYSRSRLTWVETDCPYGPVTHPLWASLVGVLTTQLFLYPPPPPPPRPLPSLFFSSLPDVVPRLYGGPSRSHAIAQRHI